MAAFLACYQYFPRESVPSHGRGPRFDPLTRGTTGAHHLKAFTPQHAFGPCIQARASIIPTGPDCLHEIKDHGYRLMVQREDDRVRLFTRGGFHGTDPFPLIVRGRPASADHLVCIDGEAV